MSGSHLIRRLRNLDLESSEELELSTDPGPPKSPTKSPTKTKSSSLRPSAFHPYNLSASGMLHIMFCFKKNPFSYRLGPQDQDIFARFLFCQRCSFFSPFI